jgi:hypothetical protein
VDPHRGSDALLLCLGASAEALTLTLEKAESRLAELNCGEMLTQMTGKVHDKGMLHRRYGTFSAIKIEPLHSDCAYRIVRPSRDEVRFDVPAFASCFSMTTGVVRRFWKL